MKLFILAFCFLSSEIMACPEGMSAVRNGAKLVYLDAGSFVQFNKDIELPSFDDKSFLSQDLWVSYPVSSKTMMIKKGTVKKVKIVQEYDDGNTLLLENFYPLTIGNQYPQYKIKTVGDFLKASKEVISICKKD